MKKMILFFITLLTLTAKADGLFIDCLATSTNAKNGMSTQDFMGMTCTDLKSAKQTYNLVSLSLAPASAILVYKGIGPLVANGLAGLGLTLSAPAILSITVVSSVGYAVFYIVLDKEIQDCLIIEREKLKEDIMIELSKKTSIQATGQEPLTIQGK